MNLRPYVGYGISEENHATLLLWQKFRLFVVVGIAFELRPIAFLRPHSRHAESHEHCCGYLVYCVHFYWLFRYFAKLSVFMNKKHCETVNMSAAME